MYKSNDNYIGAISWFYVCYDHVLLRMLNKEKKGCCLINFIHAWFRFHITAAAPGKKNQLTFAKLEAADTSNITMTDNNSAKQSMKWRVVMTTFPHERLEDTPDYWWYQEEKVLGEYATEEEAVEAAKRKMLQMGQFQGWADDVDNEDGYFHGGPPYSTTDDPDGAVCEDEHTMIEVEEIEAKTAAETRSSEHD